MARNRTIRTLYVADQTGQGIIDTNGLPANDPRADFENLYPALLSERGTFNSNIERSQYDAMAGTEITYEDAEVVPKEWTIQLQIPGGTTPIVQITQVQFEAIVNFTEEVYPGVADRFEYPAIEREIANLLRDEMIDRYGFFNASEGYSRAALESENIAEAADEQAEEAYREALQSTVDELADEQPEKIRLAQQCVLLSIMKDLAAKNSTLGYDNDKMILLDGDPDALVNLLTKRDGETDFNNICPEQLAELTPYVRMYKVRNPEKNIEKHIEFSFDQGISSEEISSMYDNSYSRGRGVGLKSVDWNYMGSNPFTATRSIEVNIELFFQSLDELFRTRFDENGEKYAYVDLILQGDCREDKEPDEEANPEDSTPRPKSKYQEEFYPECFEIKLDLGWSDPGPSSYNALGEVSVDRKISAAGFEATRTSLFLSLTDHDLSIQQDGTVNLKANYQGRVTGLVANDPRANVFLDPKDDAEEGVMAHVKRLDEKIKEASCLENDNQVDKLKKELNLVLQNQRQSLVAGIARDLIEKNYMNTIEVDTIDYFNYINRIKTGALIPEGLSDYLDYTVFKIQGPSEQEYQAFLESLEEKTVDVEPEESEEGSGITVESVATSAFKHIVVNPLVTTYMAYKWFKGELEKPEAERNTIEDYIDGETRENFFGDHVEFHYFYLGDLVEIVTERVLQPEIWANLGNKGWRGQEYDRAVEKIRIVLGTINIRFSGDDDFTTINIADIPISLALFLDWMKDNVIDSERREYPLVKFLQDIMQSLVAASLGSNCFESALAQRVKVQKTFFSSSEKSQGEPFAASGGRTVVSEELSAALAILQDADETEEFVGPPPEEVGDYGPTPEQAGLITDESGNVTGGANFYLGENGQPRLARVVYPVTQASNFLVQGVKKDTNNFHYIMFYMDNASTRSLLRGDEAQDELNGIYHFRLGEECGLLKRADFKKTNVAFFREARFSQQNSTNPLAQLSNVYDVELTMVGNNLFIPGKRLYFDPRSISKDIGAPYEPGSRANLLGIGGYHMVTNVKSYIQEGKFETSVSATWETGGGDTIGIRDSTDNELGGDCGSAVAEATVTTPGEES